MKRFHYPLDAMLRHIEWEIEALKSELATLNQVLAAQVKELEQLGDAVRAVEREILDICKENAIIDRDRKTIAELYLRDRQLRADEKLQEVEQTRALVDQVYQQLSKKKQSHRALEKHRERKKRDFDAEGMRLAALEADELWLARIAIKR